MTLNQLKGNTLHNRRNTCKYFDSRADSRYLMTIGLKNLMVRRNPHSYW